MSPITEDIVAQLDLAMNGDVSLFWIPASRFHTSNGTQSFNPEPQNSHVLRLVYKLEAEVLAGKTRLPKMCATRTER